MKAKIKDITGYPIRNLFGQMLMTQEILNRLPEWGASSDSRVHELKAVAHYFGGGFDAWLVEFSPETGKCFGFVRIRGLGDGELGYFSIQEMLRPVRAQGVPVTICQKMAS